jgi:hypothetical protein
MFNKDLMKLRIKERYYRNGVFDRNQPTTNELKNIHRKMSNLI